MQVLAVAVWVAVADPGGGGRGGGAERSGVVVDWVGASGAVADEKTK